MSSTHQSDPCIDETFTPRHRQEKINVFISSTFLDMKAERDELTLRIFPYLRKICEERGIAWGEVDLRWGIPEEKTGEALSICMQYIDRCRPYFIGMLGERYGWVDEEIPKSIIEDYPWLDNHHGKSITELEFIHGVLNNPEMNGYSFFYFRDPEYLKTLSPEEHEEFQEKDPIRIQQLAELKKKVRESKYPLRENYSDPIAFGELVKEDLMRIIDSLTPPPQPQTDKERGDAWLDREEIAHETFAESRFGVYVRRQEYFDRLDSFVDSNNQPIVITGTSGSGKSALLAHWGFQYRNSHSDDFVLLHFVGASSESSDWAMMLRRVMGEFKRRLLITSDIPEKDEELRLAFANWLSMAGKKRKIVLIIDGLNQLEDRNGAPDLVWLPPVIPENVHILLSTLSGRSLDAVRARGWDELEVEPLRIDERKWLISCYLKRYNKELSGSILDDLVSAHQNDNPLFLRALLEEIRIHGEFNRLNEQIQEYLTAETVVDLYEKILARYERDYERDRANLVKDTVSLIWASRRGLSKTELMDLLGSEGKPLAYAIWAPLYLAMEHSLVEKNGLITFFHDYFRDAVEKRYILDKESAYPTHLQIAEYFEIQPINPRKVEEYPWQLVEAREWDRVVRVLTDPEIFVVINGYDLREYWVKIESKSTYRIVSAYRSVLGTSKQFPFDYLFKIKEIFLESGNLNEALNLISFFLEFGDLNPLSTMYFKLLLDKAVIFRNFGDLQEALNLLQQIEHECRGAENYFHLQLSLVNQSNVYYTWGEFDKAMVLLKEAESISIEKSNCNGLPLILINQANIQSIWGNKEVRISLYKRAELLYRELGDQEGLCNSLINQGGDLCDSGDYYGAMELFQQAEIISRRLGDKKSLIYSLDHQGIILSRLGDLDKSLIYFIEQEELCRELNNEDELQKSLGNQADLYFHWAKYDESNSLLMKQEEICRKLNNQKSLQETLGNLAGIKNIQGDHNGAMELYKEQEQICRKINYVYGLQRSLNAQAIVLFDIGKFDSALGIFKENELYCRENNYKPNLASCLLYQAAILKNFGDIPRALKCMKEAEIIYRELNDPGGIAASLNNQAIIHEHKEDFEAALECYDEVETISMDLNDLKSLQACLGNKAIILFNQREYHQALVLQRKKEQICRSINYPNGIQISLGNQANILSEQGDQDGAMKLLKEQEEICRKTGDIFSLSGCLGNQASINCVMENTNEALKLYEEQKQICRDLNNISELAISMANQALILSSIDHIEKAFNLVEEASQLASSHGFVYICEQILPILEEIRAKMIQSSDEL